VCIVLAAALGSHVLHAQETFPVNGVFDERAELYAITNAHIRISPTDSIPNGTMIVRKGIIEAVGASVPIPKDAVVLDMEGSYIYPSFIDLYSSYGVPAQPKMNRMLGPQMVSRKRGAYSWNQALKPEFNAFEHIKVDTAAAKKLRAAGFGVVLTHNRDGICRGTGALVTLAEAKDHRIIIKDKASGHYAFNKGSSPQNNPNSLMGMIALLRQAHLDGKWYKTATRKRDHNISLQRWNEIQGLPSFFEVNVNLSILRADKVGDEFGKQYIIKGKGDEYQIARDIKATGAPLIVTLNFPKPFDVTDPYDAEDVRFKDLKHWELAPANAAMLHDAGITFAFSSSDLEDPKQFLPNLRKAVKNGLPQQTALAALTTTPAKLVGQSASLGTLHKGKAANFIVVSKNVFDPQAKIYQNWVQGKPHKVADLLPDRSGNYKLDVGDQTYTMTVTGDRAKPQVKINVTDTTHITGSLKVRRGMITLSYQINKNAGLTRLSGWGNKQSSGGKGQQPNGSWVEWAINYTGPVVDTSAKKETPELEEEAQGKVIYPFAPYGNLEVPRTETVLIRNATVWTNDNGVLKNTDVLIKGGKIASVGKGLPVTDVQVIDGTGKHLTSGIIDEHSHICIQRGVNEGTQASSAEVRIGDVVNSADVNMYRQLAGGVTAAQLLHGSANPIGGQSGLIKFRWGYSPEKLKIAGADGFIKFALGENVKQSNWGPQNSVRFPQTRMGVEQVYYDHFTRAKEYGLALKTSKGKVRRDLELEALWEILMKKRFITCHSYRQSEINMLMHVGDSMGFTVNTFTHILEGYKVADKMKAHGAGGSTFSDWWSYKYEVIYAIPHNAGLMTQVGVVSAINSDDAEMGRRLNQEAAKSVKYGDLSQEEAWKLVTLNPAILLHLDDHMGKVKVGYDADVVLWSANPLSVYAKTEMTWVDGIRFFDMSKDMEMRKWIAAERARIIQKMLAAKNKGAKTQPVKAVKDILYHCDTIDE
jgi:imidazolonepropionase-like amidohydrolase